ncbi:MAG: aldo/keto reductase [Candidatus Andersenbacteria bacterium]|nr:aldo/keto reductase [bacterium]MDZ4225399.1 aldo/keto reductase [Candidatus Andersenbacteria bacterium]
MTYNFLGNTNLKVSQIGLGTVEIGLPYDITDKKLPTDKEADYILKSAVELGITYVDTARGYGLAEERIGKSGIGKNPDIVIGTKCAQFLEKGDDPRGQELEQLIRQDIATSLKLLQQDSLQLIQLHGGTKAQIERGELIAIMQKIKGEGTVQHVGIAVRGEEAALAAINSGSFETIQLAHSVLDQRLVTKVLPLALQKNIGIINRSVLLKGVLTSKRNALPDSLAPLKQNADQAAAIAARLGTPLPDLAVKFVLANPAVSTALIGTIKQEHIKNAIKASTTTLSPEILSELQTLAISNPNQVDPSHWNQ